MVWPPPTMSTSRTNDDPQLDTHPADHDALALGVNDTVDWITTTFSAAKQFTNSGSLPTSTWTLLSIGTIEWSVGEDIWGDGNSINTDVGGFILFFPMVQWAASNGTGRRMIGLSSSDTTSATNPEYHDSARGITALHIQQAVIPYRATVGRNLHLWGYQDSGVSLALTVRKATALRLSHVF